MRHPRSGIGAELVPLVLILACLAGSLTLIVTIHRRHAPPPPSRSRPLVVVPLTPRPKPKPGPPPQAPVVVEVPEPEPPPLPVPEDPTPRALAKLTAAEADQLLEASRADRRAAAMEQARASAMAESERWRRRESLVRSQLFSLETRLWKLESEADELSFERDALEKERDARKAAAARASSRPGQAILPHKGQNGTWRRPIVVECTNGMAILRPQGIGFGLLELASGFGPSSNPFVATVAREAIRIQGKTSPDGQPVVPYIFFLVRPDGIRPYYEARGRLEALGITFGYELADQDWEVEFPDLNDLAAWDGSAPTPPTGEDPLASVATRPGSGHSAEDSDLPSFRPDRRGGTGTGTGNGTGNGGEFTWPPGPRPLSGVPRPGLPGTGDRGLPGGSRSDPTGRSPGTPGGLANFPRGSTGATGGVGNGPGGRPDAMPGRPGGFALDGDPLGPDARPGLVANPATRGRIGPGGSRARDPLDGKPGGSGTADLALVPPTDGKPGPDSTPGQPGEPGAGELALEGPSVGSTRPGSELPGGGSTRDQTRDQGQDGTDPGVAFVWPSRPGSGPRASGGDGADRSTPGLPGPGDRSRSTPGDASSTRPGSTGLDDPSSPGETGSTAPSSAGDPSRLAGSASPGGPDNPSGSPDRSSGDASGNQGSGGGQPARRMIGPAGPSGSPDSGPTPPPGAARLGLGMSAPPVRPSSGPASSARSLTPPDPGSGKIVDRRFEVVVVCGPRGVTVQPGGYRVTAGALNDRDGLLKKQMVALVKARRAADPTVTVEPRIRFLVQAGGEKTYWAARTQTLLSGLDWPMTLQVADPDPLAILPMEGW